MAKNIYVGNLTWDATSDDLIALFQSFGTVKQAQVITDRDMGRWRGFGFVEMADDGEAQTAIDALNGTPFQGRPLTVNEAQAATPVNGPGCRRRMAARGGRRSCTAPASGSASGTAS